MHLGDGWIGRQDLSPDKKWVVQVLGDHLNLLPVGPGESKTIQDKDFRYLRALCFPDGKRLLFTAQKAGHQRQMFVRDLSAGPPRPVTPEGVAGGHLSSNGKLVAALDIKTNKWALYPVDGGAPRPVFTSSRG